VHVLGCEKATAGAVICVAVGTVLIVLTVMWTSITVDEPYFYSYGRRILFAGSFARPDPIDNSKLPVSALNVLPEWIAARTGIEAKVFTTLLQHCLMPRLAAYMASNLTLYAGRVMNISFYAVLCWLVFAWGCRIYGSSGALATTVLTAFLPMILGHTGLVTVDVAATCTIFGAVYAFVSAFESPSVRARLVAGIALGLALLVKYTAVELVPMVTVILLVQVAAGSHQGGRWGMLRAGVLSVLIASAVAIAVVNLGFAFQRSWTRLADLPCRSRPFHSLRDVAGNVPLPVPYEYLNGLDLVISQDQSGTGRGSVYLLGALSLEGFASYYLVATLLKTPLIFLALLLVRPWYRRRLRDDIALAVPALWLFIHLSFFFHTQLGLRYFLPAFPFMALLAGSNWDRTRHRCLQWAASGALCLYVLTNALQCPSYLAYFNVLIGKPINAYRYLADSNLDWGQDQFALWAWEQDHAGQAYALEPYFPAKGLVIVRANDFIGINDPQGYAWLRERAAPTGLIGDSYLIFNVP
jgi:hypothetical protein